MRIISGKYKGKKIVGYDILGTRPTMDRVKESVFAMIQSSIKNSVVLDLFSGSGSLAIEAISNGAQKAYLVDNNIELIKIINRNISSMDDEFVVIKSDYKDALLRFKNQGIKFDLIFLDPPYKLNLISDALSKIVEYNLLNPGGIVVCEFENEVFDTSLTLIKDKKYGSKNVRIYKV